MTKPNSPRGAPPVTECAYCGAKLVLTGHGQVVTHDYPTPCRQVCPRCPMSLRKLNEGEVGWVKTEFCRSPEHKPPTMIVLESGTWEHTCPGCGEKIVFTVQRPTW